MRVLDVGAGSVTAPEPDMRITGFSVFDARGDEVAADAFGNNVAFECTRCCHPVLAVALENQRGSSEAKPALCRGCGAKFVLEVRDGTKKLYVFKL
jgi:hypothetical protein